MSHSNPTERYHSLDFLRALAMYLGVILHVTILFGSTDRILWNFYSEYYQDSFNYQITWGIHLFRMQFFYIIAGFFAEMVYLKKGGKYYLWLPDHLPPYAWRVCSTQCRVGR